jgi:hypothetical protein
MVYENGFSVGWSYIEEDPFVDHFSLGFHSDEGVLQFKNTTGRSGVLLEENGLCSKTGDILGVCIDYETNLIFFTRNGKIIDQIAIEIPQDLLLYPAIGGNDKIRMKVNLGSSPYLWDFSGYLKQKNIAKFQQYYNTTKQ